MFTQVQSGIFWNPSTRAIAHRASVISGIISSSEAGLAAQSLLNAPMFGAEDGKKWLRSVLRSDRNLSVKWLEAKLGLIDEALRIFASLLYGGVIESLPTHILGPIFCNG